MNVLRVFAGRLGALVLGLLLVVLATDAAAQRAFSQRFTTNANGDVLMIGNANMSCQTGVANCAAARAGGLFADNDFAMVDIDIDADGTTFNSSSAQLNMPAGSTVLFAGLYWGANSGAAARNQVLMQRPGGFGYQTVTATQVDTTGSTQYGAFSNVTAAVQAGGNGTYTVANIQRTLGTNQWAGWSLIVVYKNNAATLKNLTVFDGFQIDPVTTTVSGFLTPLSGPITTRLGFVGYDGDRDDTSAGEAFTINGIAIVDGQNPALNFYNSTISNLGSPNTARNPSYDNTLGLDIDLVNAPAGAVGNGATSATIQLGNANEDIWIQVVVFATDIYVPIITPNVVKTVTDVNGGSLNRGDLLRYNITLSNTGFDTATNVVVTDNIPANTTYEPNSLVIVSGANAGAKSDTAANDQAEFLGSPNRVVFRLGTGANGTTGGTIANGQATAIQFDVRVDNTTPAGAVIDNTATISYSGQTLGATFGTTSAAATATVNGPPTITKSFVPNTIPNSGTSVLTLVVSNPAANPSALTGVTFTDTYPANLVNTGAPSPQITCTAGSTAGTLTAAPNVGSISLTPGATIAPGGSCTVTVNVTSLTDGAYTNTTSAVNSTNGGLGNTASDTLSVGKPRITKAFSPTTILAGGTSTVTLTLMNPTAVNLTNVAFSDTLTSMQVAAVPAVTNTCGGTFTAPAAATSVNLAGGTLNAGATCTISFALTSSIAGVFSNTASGATSTQTAPAGNPSNTVDLTVIGAPVITKAFSPTSTNVAVPVQLTITVTNPNPTVTLTGVAFTDTYPDPAGASVQMTNDNPSNRTLNCTAGSTATATGGANGGVTVGISGGTLAPNGSCTITVNVESTAITGSPVSYINTTGTVTSTNGGTGAAANATLVVATLTPPTATKAFAPTNIAAGGTSVITITLTNANATAVTGVAFTDVYPTGLVNAATPAAATTCPAGVVTAPAGGGQVAFTGSINANSSCTVTVTVTSPAAGTRFNSIGTVNSANAGSSTGGSATLNVRTPPSMTKVFNPATVALNGDSTMTIVLTNVNDVALTGVGFTDTFPAGMSARAAAAPTNTCGGTWQDSGGAAISNGDAGVRLVGGTIPANGSCTLTVTVRGITNGTWTNTTGAVTATGPVALTGNTGSDILAVGTLGITKSFGTSPIVTGANSLLTFTIANSTGAARAGLAFTDAYPAGLVNSTPLTVGGTCTGVTHTATAGGGSFNVTAGNVAAGGCTITVNVTSSTGGTYLNTTSGATYTGNAVPGSPSNTAQLDVYTPPLINKAFAPTTIAPSTPSTLTFTITNNNGATMTGVAFTDTFPVGMVVAATPNATNTCGGTFADSAGGAIGSGDVGVRITAGSITANTTCTITVDVTSAASGTYNNSTGAVTSTNMGNGVADTATLIVTSPPTAAKSFAPAAIGLNGTSTLTITLTNPNAGTAITGAAFTDTYPAGMVNDATPNASSSCGGTVTAAAGGSSLALVGGTIPAGGNCAVSVVVTGTTSGAKVNSTGAITTTNTANGTAASGTLTVLNLLTVAKTFTPATVGEGQPSVLTITLTNPNAVAVTGAAFSDAYPSGLVNTATPNGLTTCTGTPTLTAANNGASVSLSGATVPASGSCTVTVNVTSATAGSYVNSTGSVTTANAGTAVAAGATLTVVEPTLTKAFGAATIDDAGLTTLVFTLTNGTGNPAQGGIGFTETLPASLRFIGTPLPIVYSAGCSGPATVAVTGGNQVALAGIAMAATTASCTVTVGNGTANGVSNVAAQLNASCAGNPAAFTNLGTNITAPAIVSTGTVVASCLVVRARPGLTKAFGAASVGVGQTQTLAFTISNTGTGAVNRTGLSFTDTLLAGISIANPAAPSATASCGAPTFTAVNNTQPFTASNISVNAGAVCTITLTIRGVTAGTVANNAAQITAISGIDNNVTNQSIEVVQPALTKAFGAATIDAGANTTLVFTLTNGTGNPAQAGIGFTETLPASLRFIGTPLPIAYSAGCSGPATVAVTGGNQVAIAGVAMAAATASCTVTVGNGTTNGVSNVAGQFNGSCAGNPAAFTNLTGNITAGANVTTTTVTPACLLVASLPTLTKAFGAATVGLGQTQTLAFSIANTGTGALARSGLSFTDTLQAGLVIANPPAVTSAACGAPTFTATDNTQPFTASTISVAAGATCVITLTVRGTTLGAKNNTTADVTAITGANNGVTLQTITVVQPALTKAFAPAAVDTGTDSVLTFTLTNGAGNPAQGGINFTDTLPAGVVVSPTPGIASTCPSGTGVVTATAGLGVVTVTGATMSAAQASCTISVNVRSATAGTYANTNAGNITATQRVDTTGVNATLTVQAIPAITKAFGAANVGLGQTTTLVFTIPNTGTNAVARSAVAFTDTLPAGLVIANPTAPSSTNCGAPTFTAVDNTQPFTASAISIAAGATCTVTLTVRGTTLGAKLNGAGQMSALAGITNGVTNQTVTVVQPALTKAFAPTSVDTATDSVLTFTLANGTGNPAQGGINFTDTLPANVVISPTPGVATTCPSGTGVVTATAGTGVVTVTGATMSNAQASCTISVNVRSSIAGTYANTNAGNITGAVRVDTTGVNATLTVQAPATLTKAFGAANVGLGQTTTLAFSIANTGTNAVARSGISFTDTLPAGLVIANPPVVTATACGAPAFTAVDNTQPFTASTVSVAAGATCVITLTVRGTTLGAKVNGAAQITAIAGAANGVTNQTVTVVQPALTKAFAPTAVDTGTDSVLTFTLANGTGNPAQGGINFTDTLPANVVISPTPGIATTCPSGTGVVTATAGTGVVTVTGATMSAAQASCTLSVNVRSAIAGTYANTNAGNITAAQRVDTTGVNATLTVQAGATLTKAFGAANVGLGQTTTLAFSIANTGTNAVARSGISFTDTLPAGLVIANPPVVSSTACGAPAFTAVDNTQPFTASTVSVAAGATCVITLTVRGTTLGAKVNGAAEMSAVTGVTNGVTNQTVTVVQPALTKAFAPTAVDTGADSVLTFTLANGTGNPAQGGINFTDTLPTNVVISPTPGVASTCPSGAGVVTATAGTGVVTVTGATMSAAQASCTISVNVRSSIAGTYANTNAGNITATQRIDTTGVNATLTVQAGATLTKAFGAANVGLGQTTTLAFSIANTGTNAVARSGISFTDTLPAGLVIANPPVVTSTACGAPAFTAVDNTQPFSASTVSVAAGATCVITLTVRGTTLGAKINGAAQITAIAGATNGVTNQTVTVVQPALTKAFAPTAVDIGTDSVLTFTLANGTGNPAQGGINFTDTLPVNVVISPTPGVATTCPSGTGVVTATAGTGVITVTGATMSTAQASCTISVNVRSAIAGTYANTNAGNITAAQRVDTTGVNATLTVQAGATLTKAFGAANVGLGQTTTLAFSIDNTGTNAVARSGISFTDTLPAGLVIANPPVVTSTACGAPAFTAVDNTQPFTASTVSVAAGATCVITLTVRGTTLGAKVNGAAQITAIAGATNGVTNQTVTVVQPALTKAFAPTAVDVGTDSVLTFTLANGTGNPAQGGINFTDTLPTNVVISPTPGVATTCPSGVGVVTATAGTGVVTVTGATMSAAQASCTISVSVRSSIAGTYANTNAGNITAAQRVDTTGVNATLTVQAGATLTKAFGAANVGLGQTTTLAFSIANTGTNAVARSGISFTDTLPAGLVIANPPVVTSTACGAPAFTAVDNTQPFTASTVSVAAGATCVITLTVRGTTLGAKVNGAAQITAIAGATNGVTNQTVTVVQPALTKAFAPTAVDIGTDSVLTFTLANGTGNPAQGGINFTDTFPANVVISPTPGVATTCPSGTGVVTATAGSGAVTVTGATMSAAQASCTISVNVRSATAGTYTNTNAGNITAAQRVDTTGVNATLTVQAGAALTKAFGAANVGLGQTTTLAFSIANIGTNAVARSGISFTDTLPAGLVIANPPVVTSTACGAPTFTAVDNTQPFTASAVSVAAGATCVITVTVRGTTLGAKVNGAAQITAIAGATNSVTNQTVTVVQPALTKAFAPTAVDIGTDSVLTFTLANGTGNPAQGGINFTDTLPTNVVVSPTPGLATTCPSGTGVVTATAGNGVVTVTGATMSAAQASCTISVNVRSATAGTYTNTNAGNITATQRVDTTGVNATLTVQSGATLTKAFGAANLGLGQTTALTFSIDNTGTNAVARSGISFTDTLPAGLVIANPPVVTSTACGAPTFTAVDNTQPFTASSVSVAAGATCSIVLTVRGTTLGAKLNGAAQMSAVSGVANGVTNQTVTVVQPALTKAFAPTSVDIGTDSVLTFTLANGAGNPAQGGINFTDTLPAGLVVSPAPGLATSCPSGTGVVTATAGSGVVTVTGATMSAAQASCTISVNVRSATAGTYTNTNAGNITAAQRVDTTGVNATLTVQSAATLTKAFGAANVGLGQATTLAFSIANTGTNAVARSGISFTDTLPAGLVIANPPVVTSTACGAPTFTAVDNTQPFTASAVSVAAGATCVITVTVRGTTLGAKINGALQITAIAGATNGVTNQTVTVVQPALGKAFAPSSVDINTDSVLTFTLTNGTGNPAQGGINFTDTLPTNVVVSPTPGIASTCPSGAGAVTATAGSGTITVTGATMNNAQATCTISVNVRSAIAGTYANTNAGNITAAQRVDTTGVNATLTVQAAATLTKAFGAANIGLGQTTTLAFSIANTGTNAVARSGISFTDTLPAGLVIANPPVVTSTACGAPAFTAVDNTQPFTASTVSVAAGATCVITLTVRGTTLGAKLNGALQITAIAGATNGVTNQTVTVVQPALTKVFAPSSVDTNTDSVLTFTLANGTGNPAQGGINFTDTLPTNVVISPTPGIATTCPSGTGVVTATAGSGAVTVTGATMSAAQASCTISVNVRSAIAGVYANTDAGNITATQRVDTTGVNSTLTVQAAATLTKAFGAANIGLGQTTTLAFSIANTGANAVARSGISFTDTLPAGLVIANPPVVTSTACGAPTFTAVDNTQPFTASTVSVAAGATCVITVAVRGTTLGAKVNGAAQITAIAGATNSVTNQTVTVVQPALTKAFAPTAVDTNTDSVLTFTLANGTGNPAQGGINFTDTLPTNVVVSPTPGIASTCPSGTGVVTATAGSGAITVTGASMNNAQASCTISVNVRSSIAGVYANTDAGNITATQRVDTTGVNATLTVQAAATLTKAFGAANIGLGQTTTLAFSIANTGANAVARSGISFTDTLPAGLVIANPPVVTSAACGAPTFTAVDNTQPFTASTVSVAAGATCVITLTVRGTTVGAKVNGAAQITAIAGATNGVTNQTVTVVQASLGKVFTPSTIDAGGTSTLVFTFTNGAGNPAQSGMGFTDTLPAGVTVSGTPNLLSNCPAGGALAAPTFTLTPPSTVSGVALNAGVASCEFRVDVTSATPGTYTNATANFSGVTRLDVSGINAQLTVQALPTLTKAFGAAEIGVGQQAALTFTITNPAGAPARSGLAFTDAFPAGLVIANPPVPTTTCTGTPTYTAVNNTGTFTVSGIGVNAGAASCTVTVTVTSATAGAYVNGAAQVTSVTGLNNGVTNQTLNVRQATLTKAFAPTSISIGGTPSTLTFTLANGTNNPAQSGINFTDTLPSGLVVATPNGIATTCPSGAGAVAATAGGNTITVTGASLNNAQASCTISVNVSPSATPSTAACPANAANTNGAAQISGIARATNGVTDQCLSVAAATPTLAKSFSPATVAIGTNTTLTFTISQPVSNPTATFSFVDTLSSGLVVGSGAVGGTCAGGTVTATAGANTITVTNRQVSGASCTITVPVTPAPTPTVGTCPQPNNTNAVGNISGLANLSTAGLASSCVDVTATRPTIAKSFTPASIASGATSTLLVTITNPNAAAITVTSVTDTFPVTPGTGVARAATPNASTTCTGGTVGSTAGSVTLTGGTVPANSSCTFQIDVTAATSGSYANTIAAGALTTNAGTNLAAANATLTVTAVANVAITKAGPATLATGAPIVYTLVISNAGPDSANLTTFNDVVPAVVTGVTAICGSPTGGAVCGAVNVAGNTVSGTVTTLPAGAAVQITINGTAPGTGTFSNTATVTPPAGTADPVPANNTSATIVTTVQAPNLTLTKSHAGNFTVGVNGTYTLSVSSSAGTLATTGTITVVDTLPAGLTFVSATGTGWACVSSPPLVTCTSSTSIPAGGSGNPITLTVAVASTAIPAVTNTATVSGGGEPAALANDNGASDNTIVVAAAVNTFAPDGAQTGVPGSAVFYAHTFNAGLAGSVGFSVSNVPSPAVPGWSQQIFRDTNCNATLDGAEGVTPLTGTIAVNPGDQVCIIVKENVPGAAPANARDVVTVTATFNGTTTYTRTDTTTVGPVAGAGLTLVKTVRNVTQGGPVTTSNTAKPGDILDYSITYLNTSGGIVNTIVITDASPTFTLFQSAACGAPLPASLTACAVTTQPAVNGTGTVVWTFTGSLLSSGTGTVSFQVRVQP